MADADTANIIADLGDKAGANVADRYNVDFDDAYLRLELFQRLDRHVQNLANTRASVSFFPIL